MNQPNKKKFVLKKQKKSTVKPNKFILGILNQKSIIKRAQLDLEEACFKEAIKKNPRLAETGPLPKTIESAMKKYQATIGIGRGNPGMPPQSLLSFSHLGQTRLDSIKDIYEFQHTHLILPMTFMSNAEFFSFPPEGYAESHQHNWKKKSASGFAGSACGSGDTIFSWNRTVFGFFSTINFKGTGNDILVKINTNYTCNAYLEALSFGARAWGEVYVNSYFDVTLENIYFPDSFDIFHAVSPRGNHEDDEVGVWEPVLNLVNKGHEIEFTANFPLNTNHQLQVLEMIEIAALRHYRNDRCNALGDVICDFLPVRIKASYPFWM